MDVDGQSPSGALDALSVVAIRIAAVGLDTCRVRITHGKGR